MHSLPYKQAYQGPRSRRQPCRGNLATGGNCLGKKSSPVGLTSSPFCFRISLMQLGVFASSSASQGIFGMPFFFRPNPTPPLPPPPIPPTYLFSLISDRTLLCGRSYSALNSETNKGLSVGSILSVFQSKNPLDSGLPPTIVDSTFLNFMKLPLGGSSSIPPSRPEYRQGDSTLDTLDCLSGWMGEERRLMRLPCQYLLLESLSSSRMRYLFREGSSATLTRCLMGEFSVRRLTWQLLARRFGPMQPAQPPILLLKLLLDYMEERKEGRKGKKGPDQWHDLSVQTSIHTPLIILALSNKIVCPCDHSPSRSWLIFSQFLQKLRKRSRQQAPSSTPPVSRIECMPHIGAPTSTVLIPVLLATMGPMVVPQGESFFTTNSCSGTPSFSAMIFRREVETRSEAQRWLWLILATTPLLMPTSWVEWCFSAQLGWTAWAMSAEIRKERWMVRSKPSTGADEAGTSNLQILYRD